MYLHYIRWYWYNLMIYPMINFTLQLNSGLWLHLIMLYITFSSRLTGFPCSFYSFLLRFYKYYYLLSIIYQIHFDWFRDRLDCFRHLHHFRYLNDFWLLYFWLFYYYFSWWSRLLFLTLTHTYLFLHFFLHNFDNSHICFLYLSR